MNGVNPDTIWYLYANWEEKRTPLDGGSTPTGPGVTGLIGLVSRVEVGFRPQIKYLVGSKAPCEGVNMNTHTR